MTTQVQVHGLREINARLKALPARIQGRPVVNALRKAGRVVQKAAQARVRKRTGALRDNIIVSRKRTKEPGSETVQVTIRARAKKYKDNARNRRSGRVGGAYADVGPLFYARFLEFGTSKMAAIPFLRPAYETHKHELPEIFRVELAAAIERAASKLR